MHKTKSISPLTQIPQGNLINLSFDSLGNVLILMNTTIKKPPNNNTGLNNLKESQHYQVWCTVDKWSDSLYLYTEITANVSFHEVQRFSNGDLLLVCSRSEYRGKDDFDKNGYIYSADGQLTAQVLLGDGIENTQISKDDTIWTSYYDEGIFGNKGWIWENAIGKSGLVAWSKEGDKKYGFQPIAGLDDICDCYAMNVISSNLTYCYYYTEFDLVQIKNHKIIDYWHMPIAGSHAFINHANQVIFIGGYDGNHDRNAFYLMTLSDNHQVTITQQITLTNEGNNILENDGKPCFIATRNDRLMIVKGHDLYVMSFGEFLI